MTTLDAKTVARLALDAGLSPTAAAHAVAIAQRESGFRTDALNDNPATGDYSVGLWQVNYYGNLRSSRTKRYGSPEALLSNPRAQAAAMASISGGGTSWSAWTTNKGLSTAALEVGAQAVADARGQARTPGRATGATDPILTTPPGSSAADNMRLAPGSTQGNMDLITGLVKNAPATAVDAGKAIVDGAGKAAGAVIPWASGLAKLLDHLIDPSWWKRIGIFALGGALILVGLVLVFKDTLTGALINTVAPAAGAAADIVKESAA